MGLFFNRKKDKTTKNTATKKVQIGRKPYEEGKITKEDICRVDSDNLISACDEYYQTIEYFKERIPDDNESRQMVIESLALEKNDKITQMLTAAVKEHPNAMRDTLVIRNRFIVQNFDVLDVLAEINEIDNNITIDYIMDTFYANEEWQSNFVTSKSHRKLRTREEFNEYLKILYRCYNMAEKGKPFCNDQYLFIDEDGNLLEPDWYTQLIPLPEGI